MVGQKRSREWSAGESVPWSDVVFYLFVYSVHACIQLDDNALQFRSQASELFLTFDKVLVLVRARSSSIGTAHVLSLAYGARAFTYIRAFINTHHIHTYVYIRLVRGRLAAPLGFDLRSGFHCSAPAPVAPRQCWLGSSTVLPAQPDRRPCTDEHVMFRTEAFACNGRYSVRKSARTCGCRTDEP